jgi:ferric-dicitrate binding protein FerR (iron transport regulator)
VKLDRERFGLELAQGELVRLESEGTFEVACDEGRVWLTEESNARDVWLTPGQCARVSGRGLALVEAVRRARIRIGAPALLV